MTAEALHWFKRPEGYDLFGEERGRVSLENIVDVNDDIQDDVSFIIKTIDKQERTFRAETNVSCEEWITAIRSAIKQYNALKNSPTKKTTRRRLSAIRDILDKSDEDEVHVVLLSLKRGNQEIMIHRKAMWGSVLDASQLRPDDELCISLSNGGAISMDFDELMSHCDHSGYFDQPVNGVTLASSVRLRLCYAEEEDEDTAEDRNKRSSTVSFDDNDEAKIPLYVKHLAQPSRRTKIRKRMDEDTMFIPTVMLCVVCMIASVMAFGVFIRHFRWHLQDIFDESRTGYGPNLPARAEGAQLLVVVTGILTLCVLAFLLGMSMLRHMWLETIADIQTGVDVKIFLTGHAFVSPDEPARVDFILPKRFAICEDTEKACRNRWTTTKHWREQMHADTILFEPNEHFTTIMKLYPHFFCGVAKNGCRVYYERPGELDLKQMKQHGIGIPEMLEHWLFINEYQYRVLSEDPTGCDEARAITIIDVDGVSMGSVLWGGDAMTFLKKTISIAGAHYPERSMTVCLINVPGWFGKLWSMISGLVHENTRKKVRILSKKDVLSGLRDIIDDHMIPEYYGGGLRFEASPLDDTTDRDPKDSCRWYSPESRSLFRWMELVNQGKNPSDDPYIPRPHGGNGIAQALPDPNEPETIYPQGPRTGLPSAGAAGGNGVKGSMGALFASVDDPETEGVTGDSEEAQSGAVPITPGLRISASAAPVNSSIAAAVRRQSSFERPTTSPRGSVTMSAPKRQNGSMYATPMSAITSPSPSLGLGNDVFSPGMDQDDFSITSATTAGGALSPQRRS